MLRMGELQPSAKIAAILTLLNIMLKKKWKMFSEIRKYMHPTRYSRTVKVKIFCDSNACKFIILNLLKHFIEYTNKENNMHAGCKNSGGA